MFSEALACPGARIADVGCGHGRSTIALARAYPDAEVVGIDDDPSSIAEAREHAAAAGVDVRFVEVDADALVADGPFDAGADAGVPARPGPSGRGADRGPQGAGPGGTGIVVDEKVAAEFTAPGDLTERLMYGWSISHCLPAAMAEQPSAALGTALRPGTVRELALAAGFGSSAPARPRHRARAGPGDVRPG